MSYISILPRSLSSKIVLLAAMCHLAMNFGGLAHCHGQEQREDEHPLGSKQVAEVQQNPIEPTPKQMLDEIIQIAKNNAIARDKVDWEKIETKMRSQFGEGLTRNELIRPTQYLLYQLGDYHGAIMVDGERHMAEHEGKPINRSRKKGLEFESTTFPKLFSRSMSDESVVNSQMLDGNIAYLEIPTMAANASQIHPWGSKLRESLAKLLKQSPKGLIVDLRTNLGGNMHPMLAGLGQVFPNNDMGGQSGDGKSLNLEWRTKNGNVFFDDSPTTSLPKIKTSMFSELPVAVLTSRYTCSSGEAVAAALFGQPNVQLFGEHTSGFSTSNDWFPINDRVIFSPAVGYFVSRNGVVHFDGITPEVEIQEPVEVDNLLVGKTIEAATRWIHKQSN